VLQATGGSTNGVVHLAAIAGRIGETIDMKDFDRMGAEIPVVVDLKPSGKFYMEDLYKAGDLTTILRSIMLYIDLDCMTVSGETLGANIDAAAPSWEQDIVHSIDDPIHRGSGIRYLTGNLAPNGAVIKQSAATPGLLRKTARAVVFSSLEDLALRLDDPDLDVCEDDILMLQNCGPKGAPGMPEVGYFPIPKKLAAKCVVDMLRISDARMSGTAFGSIVLHCSPEAAVGRRSAWSGPVTASCWTSRSADCSCSSRKPSSPRAGRRGRRPAFPARSAAIRGSIWSRSTRPRTDVISTSCGRSRPVHAAGAKKGSEDQDLGLLRWPEFGCPVRFSLGAGQCGDCHQGRRRTIAKRGLSPSFRRSIAAAKISARQALHAQRRLIECSRAFS
jgi:hypothetical protein